MRLFTTSLLVATLGLSACATLRDSRLNPANLFSRSAPQELERDPSETINPLIPADEKPGFFKSLRNTTQEYTGEPVDQISNVVVEQVPGGSIVRASGISSYDNPFDVRLVPANDESVPVDGILTFRLEAEQAVSRRGPSRSTTQRVRTVTAAVLLTNNDLNGVRVIRVEGARNAQTAARR